jgi:hypothetical protein
MLWEHQDLTNANKELLDTFNKANGKPCSSDISLMPVTLYFFPHVIVFADTPSHIADISCLFPFYS